MTFVNVPSTESADYINAQKNEWQDTYYVDNLNTLGAGGGDFVKITTLENVASTNTGGSQTVYIDGISSLYSHYRLIVRGTSASNSVGALFVNSSAPQTSVANTGDGTVKYFEQYSLSSGVDGSDLQFFNGYNVTYAGSNFPLYVATYDIFLPVDSGAGKDVSNGSMKANVMLAKTTTPVDTGDYYDIDVFFRSANTVTAPITGISMLGSSAHTVNYATLWGIKN